MPSEYFKQIVRIVPAEGGVLCEYPIPGARGSDMFKYACTERANVVIIRESDVHEIRCAKCASRDLAWHALVTTGDIAWMSDHYMTEQEQDDLATVFRKWIERCFPVPQLTTDPKP